MFRGRYEYTVDSKGRVSIPVKFREILNKKYDDRLVVTNYDHCLVAYPYEEWSTMEQKINAAPQMKKEVKTFLRFFYSNGMDCVVDKQGRLLIPPSLRDYANIEKDIVLVGAGKKIEIWDKERWVVAAQKAQEEFEQITETLADLGI